VLAWWSRAHDASPPAECCGTTSWATPACVIYVSWEVPGLPGFGEGCTVCLPAQSQLESWAWCPPPTPQMATVRPAGTRRRRLRPALVYVLGSSSHLGALYLCSELAWPVPRSRRQKGPASSISAHSIHQSWLSGGGEATLRPPWSSIGAWAKNWPTTPSPGIADAERKGVRAGEEIGISRAGLVSIDLTGVCSPQTSAAVAVSITGAL
jgi:hypothetical protein